MTPTPAGTAPAAADPVVRDAQRLVGGAWGRHAAAPAWRRSTLLALLALAALFLVAGYVEKSPCADGQWTGSLQYTHACYSDVIPLWSAERLDVGAVPYRDTAVEYPVLTGGFMWVASVVTHHVVAAYSGLTPVQVFGVVTCVLLAFTGLVMVAGTAGAAGRRPWDAAIAAASPLLVFHAFSNWDLLAMALASLALWAWARGRPVAAGVLIGLGTAAKLYPALLLVPLVVLAWRTGRRRPAGFAVGAAAAAWAATNLPVAAAWFPGWWEFYSFSASRSAEASTVWYMGHYLATVGLGGGTAPAWTPPGAAVAALLALALAGVAWVGLAAPVRPRVGQLAFLAVLAFLLTTKVWSPQYSLWLVPLLALARPRWRPALVWQAAEIAVWIATLLWLLGFNAPSRGIEYGWLMLVLLVRDALLVGLAVAVVREVWDPSRDVVRAGGLDDPAGGVFTGAPDVLVLRARRVPRSGPEVGEGQPARR